MTVHNATITDIAITLNQLHEAGDQFPPAFFMTDHEAVANPERIIAKLPKNFAVIFRDYNHPEREDMGRHLRMLCQEKGMMFLVAGDLVLAETLDADGMHLPEKLMRKSIIIRARHPKWLITAACHDGAALRTAEKLPIDAGLIAPVFPTQSHPETISGKHRILGLSGVLDMVSQTGLPLYALGGITDINADELIGSGLMGIAAIRGFDVRN